MINPVRFMIIDDEPSIRTMVTQLLKTKFPSCEVRAAMDDQTFNRFLNESCFDCVITDYQSGWSDGLTILRAVKKHYPDCPVIMFTGSGSEEVVLEAMQAGLDDYVLKSPPHDKRLTSAVHLALERFQEIKRREKAEKALAESEKKYRAIFENSPLGMYKTTPDGRILMANPAIVRLLGYSSFEELAQRNLIEEAFHPGYPRAHFIARFEHDNEVAEHESSWRKKDGTYVFVKETAKAVRDESGNIVYFEGMVEDITKRKIAEEETQFKTALFEAQAESSPDGILVVDDNGKTILFNQRFAELWKVPQKLLNTRDDEQMLAHARKMLKTPDEFIDKVKYLYTHKDEKSRDEIELKDGRVFDRHSSPMFGSHGKYYGRIWYFRDVTVRHQASAALARQADELQSINQMAINLTGDLDLADVYKLVCESLKTLTGALVTGVTSYNREKQELNIRHICSSSKVLNTIYTILGKRPEDLRYPLKSQQTAWIVSTRVRIMEGIHELTFGAIPNSISTVIEKALGIGTVYAMALQHGGQLIGTATALVPRETPVVRLDVLEAFANLAAGAIKRKEITETLKKKTLAMEEIIEHIGDEKEKIKDSVATNVGTVLIPIVDRIELKGAPAECISLLRYYLENLVSSLGRQLMEKTPRLTPREIEICSMIRTGLKDKEIARILDVSYHTIRTHRKIIRKKLGLLGQGVNLVSYLQSF